MPLGLHISRFLAHSSPGQLAARARCCLDIGCAYSVRVASSRPVQCVVFMASSTASCQTNRQPPDHTDLPADIDVTAHASRCARGDLSALCNCHKRLCTGTADCGTAHNCVASMQSACQGTLPVAVLSDACFEWCSAVWTHAGLLNVAATQARQDLQAAGSLHNNY